MAPLKAVCWVAPKVAAVYPSSVIVPSTVTEAGGGGDGGGDGGVGGGDAMAV